MNEKLLNSYAFNCQLALYSNKLPEVAQKVIAMTSDENCDASQLSTLIHRDQSLAGNILKITNSASFAEMLK